MKKPYSYRVLKQRGIYQVHAEILLNGTGIKTTTTTIEMLNGIVDSLNEAYELGHNEGQTEAYNYMGDKLKALNNED